MSYASVQRLMTCALGVIYLWFGVLKFLPEMSPAEDLVITTVDSLSFGTIPGSFSIYAVAIWEVLLGTMLLSGRKRRLAALLVLVHMGFTSTPLFLFPELCFDPFPAFTLVGQYIFKNLVLVVAALLLLCNSV
jgi:uncharacterized membrane protein YphA (DoxX/SURF4 family)